MAWTTIPATYDEAAYWIARLLAHYPRRDARKDGVVIADLCAAIVELRVCLVAVYAICDETWREATNENPWMPPSGQILADMQDRTARYRAALSVLTAPPALPPASKPEPKRPFDGRVWPDFTAQDKEDFWKIYGFATPAARATIVEILQVPASEVESNAPRFVSEQA